MTRLGIAGKLARSLRIFRNLRAWSRICNRLVGNSGDFLISNGSIRFAGNLSSFIDRQVYLYGGYERDKIGLYLSKIQASGTILDVGANVGNHSLFFAQSFEKVVAFEPFPKLWTSFEKNIALNDAKHVELHKIALSDKAGELTLYGIDGDNDGLGTLCRIEQYDKPLHALAVVRVEVLDEYLPDLRPDAIKIDVQGFEPQVLRGMKKIIAQSRPVVWVEFSTGTVSQISHRKDVEALFPYPIDIFRFQNVAGRMLHSVELVPHTSDTIIEADYVIMPRN